MCNDAADIKQLKDNMLILTNNLNFFDKNRGDEIRELRQEIKDLQTRVQKLEKSSNEEMS